MESVLKLYKNLGETPLETIQRFRKENPEYKGIKMAYAGRLDPMAEGLLVVLVGEECKNRDKYQDMSKTYEFDTLFGVETDTYDTLGLISKVKGQNSKEDLEKFSRTLSESLLAIKTKVESISEQEYPPYSSYHVQGKALWQWAKEGRLNEIEIPKKKVKISEFIVEKVYDIKAEELLNEVISRTESVSGDFRQKEIIKSWSEKLSISKDKFPILRAKVTVSSGVYVRSIAKQIGEWLGVPSMAFNILRTKVDEYEL